MFGSALYYPNVDIEDGRWLRSAALFWDDIQTIVPARIEKPYRTPDTEICEKEGYLRPLRPNLHPLAVKQLGERVRELIARPEWTRRLQLFPASERESSSTETAHNVVMNQLHLAGLYPEKMSEELRDNIISLGFAKLHRGKNGQDIANAIDPNSADNVRNALVQEVQKISSDGEWLLVSSDFSELYMAALATMLARDIHVSPLTNLPSAMGTAVESLVCDVASKTPTDTNGLIINVVIENLKIDPETPIQKLLNFRRGRVQQLAELAGTFDDFRSKIEKSADAKELEDKARRTYKTKIRPALEKLKTELQNQSIQSAWEGFSRSATVSVGAGSALAVFTGLAAPFLLGAGAFLTLADVAVKTYFARQKVRASSTITYLLDIERKFSVPK